MEEWIQRLYNLRRDKKGNHEKPHKPTLILAIINLLEHGEIRDNRIELSDDLISHYREVFEIVRTPSDQPNPHLPLFHLSGDHFWTLKPRPGCGPVYEEGNASAPKSLNRLREESEWGEFDPDLWRLLANPIKRREIRGALVMRYFPQHRRALRDLWEREISGSESESIAEEAAVPGRDAAFRVTIRRAYDYRCAACGLRLFLDVGAGDLASGGQTKRDVLIEAAHLVPFRESYNDHPTNGMALCRNHHWAVDHHLLAPCPSTVHRAGIWQVSPLLDDRIADHEDLLRLHQRPVIQPQETKFMPWEEGLIWREERLRR